ncbi:efflux RND transporter periplasmic adaptor subunit, partial [Pseudomonas stutzeri]|nr:efflux RND transporter periplasmic adaptor subunit [Stutzerimonas stutzeri]
MFRHVLSFASVLGLALTLTACGNGEPPQQLPRPVMVVHPQPASEARESYPGEVHARYEPELAFRIGGKVVERLVEAGDR